MTTAIAERLDVEYLHPVLSARLQIEAAGKELTRFEEQEQDLAAERLELIRGGNTEAPGIRSKLEKIESEILRFQTRQRREQDKISALKVIEARS